MPEKPLTSEGEKCYNSRRAVQRRCVKFGKPDTSPDGDISEEVLIMYAVIVSGGKQYKVAEGDVIEVEKLALEVGAKVELPVLLTVDGDNVVAGGDVKVKATAEVLAQGKDKKVVVFKYKAKKNVRRKLGHRQPFTKLKIVSIG